MSQNKHFTEKDISAINQFLNDPIDKDKAERIFKKLEYKNKSSTIIEILEKTFTYWRVKGTIADNKYNSYIRFKLEIEFNNQNRKEISIAFDITGPKIQLCIKNDELVKKIKDILDKYVINNELVVSNAGKNTGKNNSEYSFPGKHPEFIFETYEKPQIRMRLNNDSDEAIQYFTNFIKNLPL